MIVRDFYLRMIELVVDTKEKHDLFRAFCERYFPERFYKYYHAYSNYSKYFSRKVFDTQLSYVCDHPQSSGVLGPIKSVDMKEAWKIALSEEEEIARLNTIIVIDDGPIALTAGIGYKYLKCGETVFETTHKRIRYNILNEDGETKEGSKSPIEFYRVELLK